MLNMGIENISPEQMQERAAAAGAAERKKTGAMEITGAAIEQGQELERARLEQARDTMSAAFAEINKTNPDAGKALAGLDKALALQLVSQAKDLTATGAKAMLAELAGVMQKGLEIDQKAMSEAVRAAKMAEAGITMNRAQEYAAQMRDTNENPIAANLQEDYAATYRGSADMAAVQAQQVAEARRQQAQQAMQAQDAAARAAAQARIAAARSKTPPGAQTLQ